MGFNDELRMLNGVSRAASHTAFGLIFLRRGERGKDVAAKLKGGILLAEYLEQGKDASSRSAVCGDDLDPIRDYEVLMSYSDGRELFDQLQDSKTFLAETAKAILEGTEINVDQEKTRRSQQLMSRIGLIYVREQSLLSSERWD